jgi:hypothetical protein
MISLYISRLHGFAFTLFMSKHMNNIIKLYYLIFRMQ